MTLKSMNKENPAEPIFSVSQIRQIETIAAGLPSPPQLMEQAGRAAADLAQHLLVNDEKSILVLTGNGNNGGEHLSLHVI